MSDLRCKVCGGEMWSYTEDGCCSDVCASLMEHPRRYTIDQIVDGLTLQWVRLPIGDRHYASAVSGGYFAHHDGWWIEGEFGPARPCDSLEHAKQLCLDDYRARFRAEIENSIRNGTEK